MNAITSRAARQHILGDSEGRIRVMMASACENAVDRAGGIILPMCRLQFRLEGVNAPLFALHDNVYVHPKSKYGQCCGLFGRSCLYLASCFAI